MNPKREWRFSLWHILALMTAAAVFFWFARSVDPLLVAGTLIGGGCGALLDAMLRRRKTSVFLAALLLATGAVFVAVRWR